MEAVRFLLRPMLDNPVVWESTRIGLDLAFGLYRRRVAISREWSFADAGLSVLDVGCGIGQYAAITSGRYLGIDLSARYIDYARRRRSRANVEFRCMDITDIDPDMSSFDIVLMVDILHHLDAVGCGILLRSATRLARKGIVSFEPISEQRRWLGRWIVENDRGSYVRPLAELREIFRSAGLTLMRDAPLELGPIATRAIAARGSPP